MKYKVTYETYGKHSLAEENLKQNDTLIVETDDKDLSFYDAMVKVLDYKMAPDGYESINDYYNKTGDKTGGTRMVMRIPQVISKVMTDLKYAKVEVIE